MHAKALVFSVFAASALSAVPVCADTGNLYVGLSALAQITDVGDSDIASPLLPGQFRLNSEEQIGIGASARIGWYWEAQTGLPLRTEIEGFYRYRHDFDNRFDPNAAPLRFYQDDLTAMGAMVNLLWDFETGSFVTPYLGGGIGFSVNNSDVERRSGNPVVITSDDDSTTDFAWNLRAGAEFSFGNGLAFDLGYRFMHMGDTDGVTFSNGDNVSGEDFTAHDIMLGLVWRP